MEPTTASTARRWRLVYWGLLLAVLLAGLAELAAPPGVALADALDDETRRIARQLRCPICESVSVADSPAELAVQMRGVIRKRLEAGESEQQIVAYFLAAYGDTVLLEPPRRGLGWLIWLGPLAALGLGAVVLWLVLQSWLRSRQPLPEATAPAATRAADADDEAVALARQELETLRRGLSK